jgi:predicted CXXCH cytochrome family protein
MKYNVEMGFAVILGIAFLLLELVSSTAWALVADPPVTEAVDHSIYQSKEQCIECHRRSSPSHMFSKPLSMSESLPLDLEGKVTCVTCHDCTTSSCILRKNTREMCDVCHDCTQGMSCVIGVAHLGDSNSIESVSNMCLSCHDGIEGPFVNPEDKMINTDYKSNKSFWHIRDSKIVLVNGKVTCVSCHNPYKNEDKRLVISNEGSRLCVTCHRK